MVRLVLVLAIAGGLTLFALQNLTPISLVILGVASQPLPLAVWLLGAIVSGAATTLLVSGLISASNAFATPRSRRTGKRSPNRVSSSTSPGWKAAWSTSKSEPPKPPRNTAQRVNGDDWEPRPPLEEWEDWEGYEEPAKSPSTAQSSYVSSEERYSSSQRYPQSEDFAPTMQEQEVWDDWEDEPEDSRYEDRPLSEEDTRPRRTDFEVRQEPVARYQSGTIYSYSYRDAEDRRDSSVGKSENVYDAEFRVITPPYHPEAPESEEPEPDYGDEVEPVNTEDSEEEWLDDEKEYEDEADWNESDDRDRRDRQDGSKGDAASDDW
jgi:uncharacterized integral membrane protein